MNESISRLQNGLMMLAAISLFSCAFPGDARVGRIEQRLDRIEARLNQIAASSARPSQRKQRRTRPDPRKVHDVRIGTAPVRGDANAEVTIVEFADFQCPFCARVGPTLDRIRQEYGNKVQIVFKHLPLSIHPKAEAAHEAAEAAHRQGKFWEMHDKIFADQRGMSEERYLAYAVAIGMDIKQFKQDVKSASVRERIDADSSEAVRLGVTGTPAFFINGRFLSGAQPVGAFKRLIVEALGKSG